MVSDFMQFCGSAWFGGVVLGCSFPVRLCGAVRCGTVLVQSRIKLNFGFMQFFKTAHAYFSMLYDVYIGHLPIRCLCLPFVLFFITYQCITYAHAAA